MQIVGRLRGRRLRQEDVGTICSQKKLWATYLGDEATNVVQLENSWPEESPYKEELELLQKKSVVCVWMV